MKPARNDWMDSLRALSALAVVLFHLNVVEQSVPAGAFAGAWHTFWQYGHVGVAIFFTLSGYFLIPAWIRAERPAEFLRRRARRLLPPYWASLLLIALLALAFKLVTGTNAIVTLPRDPVAILATLTLLTTPVTGVPTINWVYWTLSYLLAFNLCAALPLFARRSARIPLLAALHVGLCLLDALVRPAPSGAQFFVHHWPVFGLGLALALRAYDRRAGTALLLVSAVHAGFTLMTGRDDALYLMVGCLTAGCLALGARTPFPSWLRPVARLGQMTYSLYLVHVPVGVYLLWRLMPAHPASSLAYVGAQLLLLAATLAAAGLFFLGCERPFAPAARQPDPQPAA